MLIYKIKGGVTALMFAVEYNHLDIVRALIEAGANLDLKNNKGETALDIAIKEDNKEIIDILTKAENKATKKIATFAYTESKNIPYLPPTDEQPFRGFYHKGGDDTDYIMEQVLNIAYGEDKDEEENEGEEESKSNRGDAGGKRRKSVRKKSRSKKLRGRRKKSKSKRIKSVRKKSRSKRRKSVGRKKPVKKSKSKRRKSSRK